MRRKGGMTSFSVFNILADESIKLSTLGKISRQIASGMFLIFSRKKGFDISCKLSLGDSLHEMSNTISRKTTM